MYKNLTKRYESEGKIERFDKDVNKIFSYIESKCSITVSVRTAKITLTSSLTALFIVLPIRAM